MMDSTGTSPLTGNVDLQFEIYDPSAACLLYVETQSNVNLGTTGVFSVRVGSATGDPKRNGTINALADPALGMSALFANNGVVRAAGANCAAGYTAANGDVRLLRVTVRAPATTGAVSTLAPDQTLNSVPHALVAETVNGVGLSGLIVVDGANSLTQANAIKLTNGTDVSLTGLHNHDSRYLRSGVNDNLGGFNLTNIGQVGIGTAAPSADLDIEKTNPTIQLGASAGGTSSLNFYSNTGATTRASIQGSDSSNTLTFSTGGAQALQLDSSQNAVFSKSVAVSGTLGLGKYDSTTEPALITALTALGGTAEGTMWEYSTTAGTPTGVIKYWDGSAAQTLASGSSGSFVKTDGSTPLSADWNVGGHKLTNLTDPGAAQDAATKNYVDTSNANGNYVLKAGDTMTGTLTGRASAAGAGTAPIKLPTGVLMTAPEAGAIEYDGTSLYYTDSTNARKQIATGGSLGNYVLKAGDTMTGSLNMRASTAAAGTAPYKMAQGVLMTTPEAGAVEYDGTNFYYTDSTATRQQLAKNSSLGNYVLKAGDTMSGVLDMGTHKVTNVVDPTNPQEAATKNYVDTSSANGNYVKVNGSTPLTGNWDIGAFDITNAGNVYLAASKNLGLGQYAADPATGGWGIAQKGYTWFNTTSNQVKYWDGSAVQALGISGAGLTSLNGQTGSTQTFATGSSGNAPAFSSAADTHTLNIPLASSAGSVTSGTISNADYVNFNAKVNRAGDTMTGTLNLPASTAAAGTAPAKIAQGVLMTTPEAGAVEYDGTSLYYTDSTATRRTVANTAALGNYVLKAGDTMTGTLTNTAAGTAIDVTNDINVGGSYKIGTNRVISNPGTFNFFAGVGTGAALTTGSNNTFVGFNSGNANTSGVVNTFVGSQSGASTTTGTSNVFVGYSAGGANTTGSQNVIIGHNSGAVASTATGNTFVGQGSGFNVTGNNNSMFGIGSGGSVTTGADNTFIGHLADGAAAVTGASALGANAKATANNAVQLGGGTNANADTLQFEAQKVSDKAWIGGGATAIAGIDTSGNIVKTGTAATGSYVLVAGDTMTGTLNLPASTAAAGTSPLKIAQGVLMTTPEAGAVEYDGTSLYYTDSTATRRTVASTAALGSYVLKAGDTMTGTLTGRASAAGAGTAPIKLPTGVLMTTPEAGAIEYDGTSLYYTDSTAARQQLAKNSSLGNYVLKAGDTMSGVLDMGTHKITNVVDPTNPQEAATKNYVDTSTGNTNYVRVNGSTPLTGNWDIGAFDITNTGNINMAASKTFGLSTQASDPNTTGWNATQKGYTWFNTTTNQVKYWDGSAIQALGVSGAGLTSLNGQTGSTQTFATGSSGNAPAFSSAADTHTLNIPLASSAGTVTSGTISNADYVNFNAKVNRSGDTMTGTLNLPASTAAAGTAPAKIAQGVLMTTPEAGAIEYDGTSLYYTDSTAARQQLAKNSALGNYVLKAGDTMTGTLTNTAAGTAIDVTNDINVGGVYKQGGSTILNQVATGSLFVGTGTGTSNTTGFNSVFVGSGAGAANTTGYENTFIGQAAGAGNTTGYDNTFVGRIAGMGHTTGASNVYVGNHIAYTAADTGSGNVYIGSVVAPGNTTGSSNVFIGLSAGTANTTGSENTFIGQSTGQSNTTGMDNTSVGRYSGAAVTTGGSNAFFGETAGNTVTTGSNNTFIGTGADGAAAINGATALGYNAKATAANAVQLGAGTNSNADTLQFEAQRVSDKAWIGGGATMIAGIDTSGNITKSATAVTGSYVLVAGDTMTGTLNLPASTAAAGTSPLKIAQGVLMTTPEAGAIEYDGTSLYYTDSTATRRTIANSGSLGNYVLKTGDTMTGDLTTRNLVPDVDSGRAIGSAANRYSSIYGNSLVLSSGGSSGASLDNAGGGNYSYLLFKEAGVNKWSWRYSEGSDGFLGLYDYHGTAGVRMAIQDSTGRIGIGTTSPSAKLEVAGSIKTTGAAGALTLGVDGSNNSTIDSVNSIYINGNQQVLNTASGNIGFGTPMTAGTIGKVTISGASQDNTTNALSVMNSSNVSLFLVRDDGNVGIGTTSPQAVLHAAGGYGLIESNSGTTGSPKVAFVDTALGSVTTAPAWFTGAPNDRFRIYRQPNISTAGTEYLTVINGGNVGIGVTNPSTILDINGAETIREIASPGVSAAGKSIVYMDSTSHTVKISQNGGAYADIATGVSGGYVAKAGDTMTGTLNAPTVNVTTRLQVPGDGVGPNIQFPNGTSLTVGSPANSKQFTLSWDGKVAMGGAHSGAETDLDLNTSNATTTLRINSADIVRWDLITDATLGNLTVSRAAGTGNVNFSNSNVGIGTTAPSARLQLPGSAAGAANTASLKLGSGTLLTTAEAGAVEYDGTNLYFTDSGAVRRTLATTSSVSGSYVAKAGDTMTGALLHPAGTAALPSDAISTASNGFWAPAANNVALSTNGAERLRVDNNGNVGIGTTSPVSALHVESNTTTTPQLTVKQTNNADWSRINLDGNGKSWIMSVGAPGSGQSDEFNLWSATLGSNVISATNAGQVGIGTTSPTALLHISKAQNNDAAAKIENTTNNTSASASFYVANDAGSTGFITSYSSGYTPTHVANRFMAASTSTAGGVDIAALKATGDIRLYTGGANAGSGGNERMRIDSSGNVGIGTTSPGNKLEVAGASKITRTGAATQDVLQINNDQAPAADVGSAIQFTGQDWQMARISGNWTGAATTNGYLAFWTKKSGSITEQMRIDNNGNVGIGTTTPGEKLQVAGNVRASGQLSTGSQTIVGGTSSVDWNNGNAISTDYNCAANIAFVNLRDGGTYTLVITDTATTQCNFSTTTTGTDAATVSYRFSPANAVRGGSSHTVYTLMRVGTIVYVSWASGF